MAYCTLIDENPQAKANHKILLSCGGAEKITKVSETQDKVEIPYRESSSGHNFAPAKTFFIGHYETIELPLGYTIDKRGQRYMVLPYPYEYWKEFKIEMKC